MSKENENQQEVLFKVDDDAAFLLPKPELEKRYTAGQVLKIEKLRNAVIMLLPMWPVEDIAKGVGISTRTVRALAAHEAEKVAGSVQDFKAILRSRAARWIAIASTREMEAPFPALVLASKLMLDAANQLDQTGSIPEERVVIEERNRQEGIARLRALKESIDAEIEAEQRAKDVGSVPKALGHNKVCVDGSVGEASSGSAIDKAASDPSEAVDLGEEKAS